MEEKNTTMGTTETMEDYKEALEASYRRIRPVSYTHLTLPTKLEV